jgi:hypothetical protein
MKMTTRLLLCCVTLLLLAAPAGATFVPRAASAGRQGEPIVGGYKEVNADDPGVMEAARFAVKEEGRRDRRPVSLVAVRRAERQVVAGYNYRLDLNVRVGSETREASALVYLNPRNVYTLSEWKWQGGAAAGVGGVKVYLVALDDKGKRGRKIGCDDSLVPVTRPAAAGGNRLKTTVEALIAEPRESEGGLNNYWHGEDLKVRSAAVRGGTATIRVSGVLPVAGICDEPRIEEQIKATARQFPGVRRVRVFVNGRPLAEAIR